MRACATLAAALLAFMAACDSVPQARLNHISTFTAPSVPSATPRPLAMVMPTAPPTHSPPAHPKGGGTGAALTDCTRVVIHSFTAQPQGGDNVLLAWSTSGACTPVAGWIGGSYGAAGGLRHWTIYIHGASGTYMDAVPKLPNGTAPIYCVTDVVYMLSIGGSGTVTMYTARNVYIC